MAKGYLYDNGDELISREDVNEVPDSSTAHAGDILELDSNKKPKWTTPESELPSTGSASEGDVLSLNASKEPVWSAPSGGGGESYRPISYLLGYDIADQRTVKFFYMDDESETAIPFSDLKSLVHFPIYSLGFSGTVIASEEDGSNYINTVVAEVQFNDTSHLLTYVYWVSSEDAVNETDTEFPLVSYGYFVTTPGVPSN